MTQFIDYGFLFIGAVITIPFIFLCYKFHQCNQYKVSESWFKMLGWFIVMIFYWLLYFTK
jgi:hypothetical protein